MANLSARNYTSVFTFIAVFFQRDRLISKQLAQNLELDARGEPTKHMRNALRAVLVLPVGTPNKVFLAIYRTLVPYARVSFGDIE